jgi:hypothetical protein
VISLAIFFDLIGYSVVPYIMTLLPKSIILRKKNFWGSKGTIKWQKNKGISKK